MTFKSFILLFKLIMDKHGWNKLYENHSADRKTVKYIDLSIDTRTGEVFSVKFRSQNSPKFNEGNALNPRNMKKDILDWLKGGD
ncbi:MAG: hypothetical protein ACOC1O_02565 [bacterium]